MIPALAISVMSFSLFVEQIVREVGDELIWRDTQRVRFSPCEGEDSCEPAISLTRSDLRRWRPRDGADTATCFDQAERLSASAATSWMVGSDWPGLIDPDAMRSWKWRVICW
jgi:hypothetical protein